MGVGGDNLVKPLGEYVLVVLGQQEMWGWDVQGCWEWFCGVHVLE